MSRDVLLSCDWRSCELYAQFTPPGGFPAGWAEIVVTLQTSGPLDEGSSFGSGKHSRTIILCPDHARGLLFGRIGDPKPDRPELER